MVSRDKELQVEAHSMFSLFHPWHSLSNQGLVFSKLLF